MEAAKKGKGKKRKKRGGGKAMTFRSNLPAEIPDRGAGVTGYFGVLDSWIRVGRAMRGKRVADVDAGFSVSGPPDQLEDIGVYLQAPNGAFTLLAKDNGGQTGNTSYGTGNCRGGATRLQRRDAQLHLELRPADDPARRDPLAVARDRAAAGLPPRDHGRRARARPLDAARRGRPGRRHLHAELLVGADQAAQPGLSGAARRHPGRELERRGVIVIGIDPGAANTGFGVVRTIGNRMVALDGGVIETAPDMAASERLARIHDSLGELISWHEPKAMALEDLFFGRNVCSALSVGQARGVAMLAAAQKAVPCFDYTPQAVKKAVCGSGAAGKEQVQQMVATLLGLPEPPSPDHAADAFAVAICHAGGAAMRRAVAPLGAPGRRRARPGAGTPRGLSRRREPGLRLAGRHRIGPEGIRAAAQNPEVMIASVAERCWCAAPTTSSSTRAASATRWRSRPRR